jgi:DHA2 family multidrug resistance protein-like MFS transporter
VAVYRAELADTMPAGLPPDTADAARDTLGGAVAAAAGLSQETGGRLTEAANAAYVSGVHVTAMIGAVVLLGSRLSRRRCCGTFPASSRSG